MIHGPALPDARERAKAIVAAHYEGLAHQDVPAGRRAMYVRKAEQARLVVEGGSSPLIEQEARLRRIDSATLAQSILDRANGAGDALELQRIALNVEIEQCESHAAIVRLLARHGMAFAS
ncbi:hypothetical protein ABID82_005129 [Methylobacterium sp. PvP062]|uniref:Uncharacterized protein n=1 Tax=Methylobacterium radiotolerans TaxID=31998 RepID=A0ABV2NU92_9HYPH|nr:MULTISPECIES: hypothetical protein [unclassified Methylobacterium]MBP2498443.1 hypothetical protein [Methylobacterium sp. PvP105]MBP2505622.1 hypothetical protein [Methylobacterium sp. PvP109]